MQRSGDGERKRSDAFKDPGPSSDARDLGAKLQCFAAVRGCLLTERPWNQQLLARVRYGQVYRHRRRQRRALPPASLPALGQLGMSSSRFFLDCFLEERQERAVGVEHTVTSLDELPGSGLVAVLNIGDERRRVSDQPSKRRDRQTTSFTEPPDFCTKASCRRTVRVKPARASASAQAPTTLTPNVASHCSPPSDVFRRWTTSWRTSSSPLQTARYG